MSAGTATTPLVSNPKKGEPPMDKLQHDEVIDLDNVTLEDIELFLEEGSRALTDFGASCGTSSCSTGCGTNSCS